MVAGSWWAVRGKIDKFTSTVWIEAVSDIIHYVWYINHNTSHQDRVLSGLQYRFVGQYHAFLEADLLLDFDVLGNCCQSFHPHPRAHLALPRNYAAFNQASFADLAITEYGAISESASHSNFYPRTNHYVGPDFAALSYISGGIDQAIANHTDS